MADATPSKKYEHVRDEAVQKQLMRVGELNQQIRDKKQDLKAKRDELDENRQKDKPEMEEELHHLEVKRQRLFDEKDKLHSKITISHAEQLERLKRDKEVDERVDLMRRRRPLNDELSLIKQRISDYTDKAGLLNEQVTRAQATAPKKGVDELTKEAKVTHDKLQKAQGTKVEANIAKAMREHKAVQAQLDAAQRVKSLQDEFLSTAKATENLEVNRVKKLKEIDDANKRIDDLTAKLALKSPEEMAAERDERNKTRVKVTAQIAEKQKEIFALKQEKEAIHQKYRSDEGNMQKIALSKEVDALVAERNAVEETIPTETVKDVDVQCIPELVGKAGANLQQVESDFGVVIDIHRQEKEIIVRGSDSAECADFIRQFMEEARKNMFSVTETIDLDCAGEFIGTHGSNIQSLQTKSGANINFSRETGEVEILGTKDAVQFAQELVAAFKAESFKDEMKYPKSVDKIMRPRLMKQWQEDFHCRLIRVDPPTQTITIRGKEEDVKNAKKGIEEFVSTTAEVRIPHNVSTAAIIGAGGSVVRQIESVTGCILDVSETVVLIAGTEEAVAKGREVVEAKIRDNVSEEIKVPYNKKLHSYLTRRRTPKAGHADPNAEKKEEEPKEGEEEEKDEEKDEKANGEASPSASPPASPTSQRPIAPDACLLEVLRVKHGCFQARADLASNTVWLRGPTEKVQRLEAELRKSMRFEGLERSVQELPGAFHRYLTANMLPRGAKGMKMRIDPVRDIEGVTEVLVDPRGETRKVEIIGTEEGVKAAKDRLGNLLAAGQNRSRVFEVEAGKIGRLLGPRGQNVTDIEEQFKVMLVVPRDTRQMGRDEPVGITTFATAPPPEGVALQDHLAGVEKAARDAIDGAY
eukprot:TRINITY_DN72779_c0_g1_i1.p1 TRINITY_DN72779_c0_g1~~TRINITY_DN72779_c0_g1_i1.p1  ORF type:complete len:868 (+),score=472.21 TRINITY_DN72779_c0_g1_i1:51-2654(+)